MSECGTQERAGYCCCQFGRVVSERVARWRDGDAYLRPNLKLGQLTKTQPIPLLAKQFPTKEAHR